MTTSRRLPPAVRRVLPWLLAWWTLQGLVAVTGRLVARRKDEGDESTAGIRRVMVLGGFELAPRNRELTRVRIDLVMAGAELDLTGITETAGIDLTVTTVMAGMAVKVPPDWRVWSRFRGVGGLGTDGGVQRTSDEHAADLRVHGRALFGGIGVEAG
jgi:hypothetical protein